MPKPKGLASSDQSQSRRCNCQECGPEGRILAPNEWRAHRTRQRKREAIDRKFNQVSLDLSELDTTPDPDPGPNLDGVPVDDQVEVGEVNFLEEEERLGEKWLQLTLKRVEERLAENAIEDIKPGSLRFFEDLPNRNTRPLDPNLPQNRAVMKYEQWLSDTKQVLQLLQLHHTRDQSLRKRIDACFQSIEEEILALNQVMSREMKCQVTAIKRARNSPLIDSRDYMILPTLLLEPFASLVYLLIIILHLLSGAALRLANCGNSQINPLLTYDQTLPNRVEDMLDFLKLEPKYRSYACCPKCFCTYAVEPTFPAQCTYTDFPGDAPCGRQLHKSGPRSDQPIPTREYIVQNFSDWLARLYNRPGMEEHLDQSRRSRSNSGEMSDIWDAPVLQDFKGPDGQNFFDYSGRESRLAFSLNMDGFNPFTNKQAGKQISTSGIYLICLNLLPELRYRPENIFLVGVVPGPSEPHVHEINHVLKPLIDIFVDLWETGVYLMRTPNHSTGRHVKAVIIPLVCDLPATRKVAGLGGHAFTRFCSECMLAQDDIEDIDFENWEWRTMENHRKAAHRWRMAKSKIHTKGDF
ncbi:hypothetical protein NP233_g3798 [Leucocoprinus birnbaumii]|uniref:Uncharacterized protein n=1 Tax=Leucocoprinus birnbaumii TaxID=56174 RepID=A0AAD5VYI5_9AGAR|nr:hypothetical protein NP233_g3798 [Leucocoprinus birnbaumii]